jgi:hypothetical protein
VYLIIFGEFAYKVSDIRPVVRVILNQCKLLVTSFPGGNGRRSTGLPNSFFVQYPRPGRANLKFAADLSQRDSRDSVFRCYRLLAVVPTLQRKAPRVSRFPWLVLDLLCLISKKNIRTIWIQE